MPYKKGDYVRYKSDGTFCRVLSVCDEVFVLSMCWDRNKADEKNVHDLLAKERAMSTPYTLAEMNVLFEPCTAEEAGFPDEEEDDWRKQMREFAKNIKVGDRYWYPERDEVLPDIWEDTMFEERRRDTFGIYPTEKDAEEAYRIIKEALKDVI